MPLGSLTLLSYISEYDGSEGLPESEQFYSLQNTWLEDHIIE